MTRVPSPLLPDHSAPLRAVIRGPTSFSYNSNDDCPGNESRASNSGTRVLNVLASHVDGVEFAEEVGSDFEACKRFSGPMRRLPVLIVQLASFFL